MAKPKTTGPKVKTAGPKVKTARFDDSVLRILAASTIDGNTLTLPGQLARSEYVSVNKAIEGLGGKWDKKQKKHIFALPEGELTTAMEGLLSTGVLQTLDYGVFYTPPEVAKRMASMAGKGPNASKGLEPSAGAGILAVALAELVGGKANVDCVEIRADAAAALATQGYRTVVSGDFADFRAPDRYHRILMNPPFLRNTWAVHVSRAADMLDRINGILVSVVPRSFEFSSSRLVQELRDMTNYHERLPSGTFAVAGTSVETNLIMILGKDT